MKIKRIEQIAVSLPMKKPVFMAGVEIRQADNVLVRIEADNGIVGWGEAASAPTMTGETVESMMAAVAYLTPAVEGRPAEDIAGTLTAMGSRMYGNRAAKAAIDRAYALLLSEPQILIAWAAAADEPEIIGDPALVAAAAQGVSAAAKISIVSPAARILTDTPRSAAAAAKRSAASGTGW